MTDVTVLILHPEPAARAGKLERWVAAARASNAERLRSRFLAAGATDVTVSAGPPDGVAFGERVRSFVANRGPKGLVVLGSGAIPLAIATDLRAFVTTAGSGSERVALVNNRYSADVLAIAAADSLGMLPDLTSDNGLPRWLEEIGRYQVTDLRRRWRLGVDIDGPLDLILIGRSARLPDAPAGSVDRVIERLAGVRAVARIPRAELVVSGRTSAAGLAWLERRIPARTRALVEERGMRTAVGGQRPPRSVLGLLLDRGGPAAIGSILSELGEAALIDSRVLLAHRLGADEAGWPSAEDRFASDLLLHEEIADPWLRELTRSAAQAPIPVILGGHTLVGPGVRLAIGRPG